MCGLKEKRENGANARGAKNILRGVSIPEHKTEKAQREGRGAAV